MAYSKLLNGKETLQRNDAISIIINDNFRMLTINHHRSGGRRYYLRRPAAVKLLKQNEAVTWLARPNTVMR
jgi:hypothetical protein